MILGVTGTDGAGKGTVVDYLLTKKVFTHYSASSFIGKEVERQGLPISRNQLRLTANELRALHGDDVLVAMALKEIEIQKNDNAIIESIRAIAEAKTLKRHGGILLSVDADPHVRYERVQMRRSEKDQVTFEEFLAHEALERNDPDPHGMQKAAVMEMSDFVIKNDGTLEELHAQIEEFLIKFS